MPVASIYGLYYIPIEQQCFHTSTRVYNSHLKFDLLKLNICSLSIDCSSLGVENSRVFRRMLQSSKPEVWSHSWLIFYLIFHIHYLPSPLHFLSQNKKSLFSLCTSLLPKFPALIFSTIGRQHPLSLLSFCDLILELCKCRFGLAIHSFPS